MFSNMNRIRWDLWLQYRNFFTEFSGLTLKQEKELDPLNIEYINSWLTQLEQTVTQTKEILEKKFAVDNS